MNLAPRNVRQKRNPGTYKGVRMRSVGRWVSEIRIPKTKTRIWLGSYDAPEKAARAYDAALYCVRGAQGRFNFPADEKPELPDGLIGSLSKSDIKAIAESFASLDASVPPLMSSSLTAQLLLGTQVSPCLPVSVGTESEGRVCGELLTPSAGAGAGMPTFSSESLLLDDMILDLDLIRELL